MTLIRSYLSLKGRISRSAYWLGYLLPSWLILIFFATVDSLFNGVESGILTAIVFMLTLWPFLAGTVKRLNDRNRSWWHAAALLALIAAPTLSVSVLDDDPVGVVLEVVFSVVVIWFAWELGMARGTDGPNRYGPDPRESDPTPLDLAAPAPGLQDVRTVDAKKTIEVARRLLDEEILSQEEYDLLERRLPEFAKAAASR